MNLYKYLGIDQPALDEYVNQGLIDVAHHDTFPLVMYTYGREAVHGNVWDDVTTKTRGLIVNDETKEIVARPFEKFFNLGTAGRPETEGSALVGLGQPEVHEKMDGFLCTMYEYNGEQFIASKGSFHSMHAKWATAWYRKNEKNPSPTNIPYYFPEGYTPVFEGITSNLRIVVDYGDREGLVLLALINKETGEELPFETVKDIAMMNGFGVPAQFDMTWQTATMKSIENTPNFEGYVLVWRRPGRTPFRLKVKYVDYLRIHRMVTGVSPKRVYEALVNGWPSEINSWLDESTPWFNKFVTKWKGALESRYAELAIKNDEVFQTARQKLGAPPFGNNLPTRKEWAMEFTKEENRELAGALFGILDGKDVQQILWKLVKPMVRNSKPMVDARF